ncbi:Crp/Fnr family transcriptional regulator [Chitinophaga vietnamensis]|uniref:Crp/Fnr family transcriptional regulator n=1 Tax=Chitinophaga vietnamensis TaxID=2593957 RepID=UPI00117881B6|nr:Crp/Fnr family transcriptional regulator [Chitinophaga vietnamensis]
MATDLLKEAVFRIMPLPQAEWDAFAAAWIPVTYKRKVVITPAGEIERYIYFVLEGVQRLFCLEGDKDSTIIFSYTGSFSGVMDSFQLQCPSPYCLETLTNSRMLRMSYANFEELINTYTLIERWVRLASVAALHGVLERHRELLSFSAEQKFRILLTRSPHVLQIIPHKYLASYLGIDPATFSKLLGAVKL